MSDILLPIILSMSATLGLSLKYCAAPHIIPAALLGGGIAKAAYIITAIFTDNVFFCSIFASAAVTVYSHLCARIIKAPSSVFLTPSVIPLLPGSKLYYTMTCLVFGKHKEFFTYGGITLRIGLGIAIGIISVSVVWYVLTYYFLRQT